MNKTNDVQDINTNYKEIDLSQWNRREYFYYFTKMMPTGYSISVDVDITETYNAAKKINKKFFPAYLYIVSRLISEQPEFLIGKVDDKLVQYEVLHPSYSIFHEDDKSISNMWTTYNSDFEIFYENYIKDSEEYGDKHGAVVKNVAPPQNAYMIGAIPWVSFNSYTPIPFTPLNSYFPILQAGKYRDENNRKIMPLSFTIHHAVADGYHVSLFFNKLQKAMSKPEDWLS